MQPFTHKNSVGDFFDALSASHSRTPGASAVKGATARQDAVISVLSGDLSLEHLPEFAVSLRDLLTNNVLLIVLDLSRIIVFSPNAVSVLVNFVSFVEGGGKRLMLFRPSRSVRDTLESLHLTHLFEIKETEDELLLELPD